MDPHLSPPFLLHYHVFKNAGSSFNWALREALGTRFQEYDAVGPGAILSHQKIADFVADRPETAAISSHQITLPPARLAGRAIYSTILLRDPIVRARSVYLFERRQEAPSIGAAKAKELDFPGYVEWRLANRPAALSNAQVCFCARTPETPRPFVPRESDLAIAIENLDRVNVVGTVERYREWLDLVQRVLQEPFPGISLSFARHNTTSDTPPAGIQEVVDLLLAELGQPLFDRLLEGNQLDLRLYDIADASLTRQLANRGIAAGLMSAYREARARSSDNAQPITAVRS